MLEPGLLLALFKNYGVINKKLISYIHPRSRGSIVSDLGWYLSIRIQNQSILLFEKHTSLPRAHESLIPKLKRISEFPEHRIEWVNQTNLKLVLEYELGETDCCPFRFDPDKDAISVLASTFLKFGAAEAGDLMMLNDEVQFEMTSLQQFLDINKRCFYPPPPPIVFDFERVIGIQAVVDLGFL